MTDQGEISHWMEENKWPLIGNIIVKFSSSSPSSAACRQRRLLLLLPLQLHWSFVANNRYALIERDPICVSLSVARARRSRSSWFFMTNPNRGPANVRSFRLNSSSVHRSVLFFSSKSHRSMTAIVLIRIVWVGHWFTMTRSTILELPTMLIRLALNRWRNMQPYEKMIKDQGKKM